MKHAKTRRQGGPCTRRCDVDMTTMVCKVCKLSFKQQTTSSSRSIK